MLLLDRQPLAPRPDAAAATGTSDRRATALVLACALLGTLALRLLYLHFPLGTDEGGVAFIAKAWGSGHGSLYGAYWLDRPPLLLALYKLAILGGPIGVRVLGAVAALALVAATTGLTLVVSGHRAARIAAVISAGLASSVALAAVFTPAELLASVPAAASVGCLVCAHRRGRAGWLVGAGLLAMSAALVKQSFLDAGFAGAIFLAATGIRDRRLPLRAIGAYAGGVLIPLAGVAVWLLVAHVSPGSLIYAVAGFRLQGLHTLATSNVPLQVRVHSLVAPGELSGLFAALAVGLLGFWTLRRDRVLAATVVAWLFAGAVGVLGGGSYWPHYLIQLVAPAGLLAGTALTAVRGRTASVAGAVAAAFLVTVAVTGTVGARAHTRAIQAHHGVIDVADYIRARARPGDTQYVMYARANVDYYTGLQSPYPYAWSLMVRTIPGATTRLLALLQSPQRPTWIVGWQRPDKWHLDPHGSIAHALERHYRLVAEIHGRRIYHARKSRP